VGHVLISWALETPDYPSVHTYTYLHVLHIAYLDRIGRFLVYEKQIVGQGHMFGGLLRMPSRQLNTHLD
jgi:hypothetical protein